MRYQFLCGVALCALAAGQAAAQAPTPAQIQQLQQQIQQLQQQLQSLQNQVNAQAAQPPAPATAAAAPTAPAPHVVQTSGNRFGLESADGRYSIYLSTQLHFDAGSYVSYHPDSAANGTAHGLSQATPHDLNSGINARRARFGFLGKLAGDWAYTFVYDFGGSQDSGSGGTNSAGIEKAYLTYNGLYNGPVPLAFDLGYQDVPFTLDEATSSNDILFMERATPGVIATGIAAGDNRSAFGVRSNNDRYWAGVYLTGPTSGTTHSFPEQYGAFGRFTYQVIQSSDTTLHVGVNAEGLLKPPTTGAVASGTAGATSGIPSIALSDRPELRIDPSTIINTGQFGTTTHPVTGAAVYGVELAGTWQNIFLQGEGFNYSVSRQGLPDNNFWGGYIQGAWTITGEQHKYIPGTGAYGAINPEHPFSLSPLGWGAWELAARYSIMNLNDNTSSALKGGAASAAGNGIIGGRQQVLTLGMNWYVNSNIKFLFNYLHGTIDKPSTSGENGASFDAVAMRTQVAF